MYRVLLRKELLTVFRSRSLLVALFTLSLLFVVVGSFAFQRVGLSASDRVWLTAGLLWLTFLVTALTVLNHTALSERGNGAGLAIVFSTAGSIAPYLTKCIINVICLMTLLLFQQSLLTVFFGVTTWTSMSFLLLSFLVVLGVSAAGTLLSAMSSTSSSREVLLPLLLFPLLLPLLAAAATVTPALLAGGLLSLSSPAVVFILAYDVVAFTVAAITYDYILES